MKIAFVGGGTMGPVAPLLTVVNQIRKQRLLWDLLWLGTHEGPEGKVIQDHSIPFFPITTAKIPRYPSLRWITFPFDFLKACREVYRIFKRQRPDLIVTVGGFTAVPAVMVGFCLGITSYAHQYDAHPTWTNRLIAPFVKKMTSSFIYKTSPFFLQSECKQIATPTRFQLSMLPTKDEGLAYFKLAQDKPTVLVIGGGTGATALNTAYEVMKDKWLKDVQVIHVAGKGKATMADSYEFLSASEMAMAYAASDLVVTRAGMGSLSELMSCEKPMVIVPIPNKNQQENARKLQEHDAAIVLDQSRPGFASMLYGSVMALIKSPADARTLTRYYPEVLKTDQGEELLSSILSLLAI